VSLLIECKQSVHPLVFFQRTVGSRAFDFPAVAGLSELELCEKGDPSFRARQLPLSEAVSSHELSFVSDLPLCSAFSRAELTGKGAKLSGEEPYNNIVLPLTKALDYYQYIFGRSKEGRARHSVHLCLLVCVVDSAMVLVESPAKAGEPILTPWVRLSRQEVRTGDSASELLYQDYAIDFVHIGAFESVVGERLVPFAGQFFERVAAIGPYLRHGGIVEDIDAWSWGKPIARWTIMATSS
jgi:hypothetical protein